MKHSLMTLLLGSLLCLALRADAKPWWVQSAVAGADDLLAPDDAFRASASIEGQVLRVRWIIADGYYLYRHKMRVLAESPDLSLGPVQWPRGTELNDAYLGAQEVYFQQVDAEATLRRDDYGAHPVQVKIEYQGCAKDRACYQPIAKILFPAGPALAAGPRPQPPLPWELVAIFGGCGAFLLAGLRLRST